MSAAKIAILKTIPKEITVDIYNQALDLLVDYLKELRKKKNPPKVISMKTMNLIAEVRFCASHNYKFRKDTYPILLDILDDLYVDLNEEE